MGCDIHFFIEQKRGRDDWRCIYQWYGPRIYVLFSVLADVRNEKQAIFPIAKPKGLPTDPSWRVQSEYDEWGEDAHSASWLTLDEILSYPYWQSVVPERTGQDTIADDCRLFCHEIVELLRLMPNDVRVDGKTEKTRLVFWFDN